MIVGVPKEIKDNEGRVALGPDETRKLREVGHDVLVETGAGILSGLSDEDYKKSGAKIVSAEEVWKKADMIVKVKEPLAEEWKYFRAGLIIATFFHFTANKELEAECLKKKVLTVPYEAITVDGGSRPILAAMSRVAGEVAADVGAEYLRRENGGKGVLLKDATVTIIGAMGSVGRRAYDILKRRSAKTIAIDVPSESAGYGQDYRSSGSKNIAEALKESDLVIGAAVKRDGGAPRLITREMVQTMGKGSVIVDVSIDEGGISETSRPTSHSEPTYVEEGVTHYCVPNMPGAVPRSSTKALTAASFPYILRVANGRKKAIDEILSGHSPK